MDKIWSEERIRNVMKELDKKTGLKGAMLPIIFTKSRGTIGYFSVVGGKSNRFAFSDYYYQDPDWPAEMAIEMIKPEDAHDLDYETYGKAGHGPTWKICCGKLGIAPLRLYSENGANYYINKHKLNEAKSEKLDRYDSGVCIEHPKYGKGVIKEIVGAGAKRLAKVEFAEAVEKLLSLSWIDEKCKTC